MLFKEEELSTTIETDLGHANFNFAAKKYFPFEKANNTPLYTITLSKQPPTFIKQLLK